MAQQEGVFGSLYQRDPNSIDSMRKYSLWGDITLQYDDMTENGTHSNSFAQNYTLNFRSYVIHPRIMIYTLHAGFNEQTGSLGLKGSTWSYGGEASFLNGQPFNFSIRASRLDTPVYKETSYGLSMAYTRKVRISPAVEGNTGNRNAENNVNNNKNAGNNGNDGNDGNNGNNANAGKNSGNDNEENNGYSVNNNYNNSRSRRKILPPSTSSSIFDLLPITTLLDIDRVVNESSGTKSGWDNALLRTFGKYRLTSYNWNFNYTNWRDGSSSANRGYSSGLNTDTKLNWTFFNRLENNLSYRKDVTTVYDFRSLLSGPVRKWGNYDIDAQYFLTSNSESFRQYHIKADVTNLTTPYLYKGVNLTYSASLGFEGLSNNVSGLLAGGTVSAVKHLKSNMYLHSDLSLLKDPAGTKYDLETGISYTFRPRTGYTARLELDPKGNVIKTTTLPPQVSGWDYAVTAGYTVGIARDTRQSLTTCTESGCSAAFTGLYRIGDIVVGTNNWVVTHKADLRLNAYLRGFTLSSAAALFYSSFGQDIRWDNTLYFIVMRRIGVTIGTGFRSDMPNGGVRTTEYSVYNLIDYRILRNLLLRVDSKYLKTMPADATTLEITPRMTWQLRKVFVELEVTLRSVKANDLTTTNERRIMLRVTRPFKIL